MAHTPTCAALLLCLSAAILSMLKPCGCEVVNQDAVVMQVEVGGSVQMDCDLQGYFYLYWQKTSTSKAAKFVNGLAVDNSVLPITEEYSNRSRVYKTNGTLELWNLKVSDTGYYTCEKVFKSKVRFKTISTYHLLVKADYTQPALTTHSSDSGLLEVTCSSWGGSPHRDIQWFVLGEPNSTVLLEKEKSTAVQDPTDLVWNLTSTVELNCTRPLRIACAVDNTTSKELEICAVLPVIPLNEIIAITVVGLLVLGMPLGFLVKLLNRPCQDSDGERARAEQMPLRTTPDSSGSEAEMSGSHVVTLPQDPV